jgi:LPXTG-site transpeptidase (sortase) family protein
MLKKSQIKFVVYFAIIFILSFVLLYSAGLVPESIKQNQGDSLRTLWDKAQKEAVDNQLGQDNIIGENPTRIVIDKIGVDSTISNPNTTNVTTLDEYLKQGAVRYPGSGLLGFGNMFIFGHSTGIKVVNNQAYKTFNGLKDLKSGDLIKIYSTTTVYKYMVRSVTLVDQNKALVEFGNNKNMLTLSTCNTFGDKGERYVVEADYIQ